MTRNPEGPRPGRFAQAVAAALFLAVCAYIGAALVHRLRPGWETAPVRRAAACEELALEGLVLRREQPVPVPEGRLLARDGCRLAAGAPLAESGGETLCAPVSALFYTGVDGLEGLTPEAAEDLSVGSLRALLAAEPADTGGTAGRLVLDSAWFYAALAPADRAPEPGACRLRFDGLEEPVSARLLSVSPAEDGQRALLFRLTQGGRAYLSLRRTGARLILEETGGLELPEEAVLHTGEGQAYVLTLSPAGTEEKPVELLYTGQGRCIAAESRTPGALREGDTLVIPGSGIPG